MYKSNGGDNERSSKNVNLSSFKEKSKYCLNLKSRTIDPSMRNRVTIKLKAEPQKEATSWGPGRGHMKIRAEEN